MEINFKLEKGMKFCVCSDRGTGAWNVPRMDCHSGKELTVKYFDICGDKIEITAVEDSQWTFYDSYKHIDWKNTLSANGINVDIDYKSESSLEKKIIEILLKNEVPVRMVDKVFIVENKYDHIHGIVTIN